MEKDIPKYGEAPVRGNLSGPDRGRYEKDPSPVPPKTSSSSKSSLASRAHMPGHNHRHNKSIEDNKPRRPVISRGNSAAEVQRSAVENTPNRMGSTNQSSPRSKSPASSTVSERNAAQASPANAHKGRGVFGRLLGRHKDKDNVDTAALKSLPGSARSLQPAIAARAQSVAQPAKDLSNWERQDAMRADGSSINSQAAPTGSNRPGTMRAFTQKNPFKKRSAGRSSHDDDVPPDQRERKASVPQIGRANDYDMSQILDFSNMRDIISEETPMTPLDMPSIFSGPAERDDMPDFRGPGIKEWDAPESWGVARPADVMMGALPEIDEEVGLQAKGDPNAPQYGVRIFKSDGTFSTLLMPLHATVTEIINQMSKKIHVSESITNYQIIMKKHDLQRILNHGERPVNLQKRLLEQAGYTESDRIEDVGREDNSYLCRFSFVPARDSGYAAQQQDSRFKNSFAKFSHIDLSGRNLITIPIALYSKASDIVSLNLSRNLSLDVPMDFIQSCLNLREIKFNNNEAWSLPKSVAAAQRLTVLDVSNNKLEQLEQLELNKLSLLVSLKLANNRLNSLPEYFGRYRQLRTLNVSSNFLAEFPGFICDLDCLVDIDMSFNAISTLPKAIGKLKSLERFVITNNKLQGSLPDEFAELVNLKEVDIRYNALTSIDLIASLPNVEQLSADHNVVSVFEGTFEKIKILRLNSNPVTRFEIKNAVPTLTTLILSNAKLAHLPDAAFDQMPNLVKLVLDKNHFVSLPSHIGKLRNLEHFSIARNSLSSLPPEIGCLTELRLLDVRQNNLKKLPPEIWWANKLETLNISSNVLENFPKPGSRQPQVPGESTSPDKSQGTPVRTPTLRPAPSYEELGPLEAFGQRRPSQASSGLLSLGNSHFPGQERQGSIISLYGKGGRKTSVVARTSSTSTVGTMTPPQSTRKDSAISQKLQHTFVSSLKNLYMADNSLDDDVFDELSLLYELRILNLSYNELNDIPQRSLRSWPQLIELYLSGNELTSLPSDDFESHSQIQVLHINGNKFQTIPAELGKAKGLAVLDVGCNSLKYNVSNWPYDWNWNYNAALKYLNMSGNKRLEIKPNLDRAARGERNLTDFTPLKYLRILGLMDVTLTDPQVPDETEDCRVRTSGSLAGSLAYGMADTLGRGEHLSIIDMVVPRFNGEESETLLGMFDGQSLSNGGSKIAKYLHENFGSIFIDALKNLNHMQQETPEDALRRAFLSLNKDLATAATSHVEERSLLSHRGSAAPAVLTKEDLHSGGVATVMYLSQMELYVANVGDAQALLVQSDGGHQILTRKHDPAEPSERQRIRDAGGWVSRQGKLNDILEVSRAFGYVQLMPSVQAAPHILKVNLKETDEMIIVGSRELWEYLPPDLVVDVARSERLDLMRAAQRLRDLAMAYGATSKIMVMILGVSDLKSMRRGARGGSRPSMSTGQSGILDDALKPIKRKGGRKGEVDDQALRRLEKEVDAPEGYISIVFTDIKSSTALWETHPTAMRTAIKLHNDVMRRQLRIIGGYEVKTEGDAFIVSFPTVTSALLWCFSVQHALLDVAWPAEILNAPQGVDVYDNDQNLIYRGLSVRMGIHYGAPVCEIDPVTRRMDYFGPMVNRAARISSVADGGQITVSSDFISEIQRCLETFSDLDRSGSTGSDDTFESDSFAQAIRRELKNLSSQGFEVKDMGERKLKGLENPEHIYLMYPHALAGRIELNSILGVDLPARDAIEAKEKEVAVADANSAIIDKKAKSMPPTLASDAVVQTQAQIDMGLSKEHVWTLWALSLRLEMICDKLELKGSTLENPEYAMMELIRNRQGEVTDAFLTGFFRHLVTRIEVSTAPAGVLNVLTDIVFHRTHISSQHPSFNRRSPVHTDPILVPTGFS